MGKPGPKSGVAEYAASLGISRQALYRMGGKDKVQSMSEQARATLVGMAKRAAQ